MCVCVYDFSSPDVNNFDTGGSEFSLKRFLVGEWKTKSSICHIMIQFLYIYITVKQQKLYVIERSML